MSKIGFKFKFLLEIFLNIIFRLPISNYSPYVRHWQAEITPFHDPYTPFATSTFIKFLIHARRFRVLLTWLLPKI
jgi:hypothetical protein